MIIEGIRNWKNLSCNIFLTRGDTHVRQRCWTARRRDVLAEVIFAKTEVDPWLSPNSDPRSVSVLKRLTLLSPNNLKQSAQYGMWRFPSGGEARLLRGSPPKRWRTWSNSSKVLLRAQCRNDYDVGHRTVEN